MKLYLVRHAQSESNVGIHTGKETALTSTGIEQAKRLGMYFKNKHLNRIYCSKMIRAKDTLKEIRPYLPNVPVSYTKRINERSRGIHEHNLNNYFEEFHKSGLKEHEFKPKGGENIYDLEKRALSFINLLKKNHSANNVLLVSHGQFLRVLIVKLFGYDIREGQYFNLHNASVSYFHINDNDKIKEFEIDDHKHLLLYSSYPR